MNIARLLTLSALLAALTGCGTTGDPRAGGLFGWSEAKALDRQAGIRAQVAEAERRSASEAQESAALDRRNASAQQRVIYEKTRLRQEEAALERQYSITRQAATLLEEASPTAATASRARAWQERVDFVARNSSLSPTMRLERLRTMNSEIDAARRALAR